LNKIYMLIEYKLSFKILWFNFYYVLTLKMCHSDEEFKISLTIFFPILVNFNFAYLNFS
jgi:hypothetical protein